MTVRFSVTLFLAAALLFIVEPLAAKMLLPLFGGVPAVWTTCMMFFQAALLLGYVYAHATSKLGVRVQPIVHFVVLLAPLLTLPLVIRSSVVNGLSPDTSPVPRLLQVLTLEVGLAFFVVSTSGPLLQAWFSRLRRPDGQSQDPYFLYAASNLGSMLSLLAYPLLIEPRLGLTAQSRLWQLGYIALVVLTAVCGVAVWRHGVATPAQIEADSRATAASAAPITFARRLRWTLLAFVPSTLLLGVTNYVTTDIATVPLFWVLPLAVYLLTFILVFSRRPPPHAWMVRALPMSTTFTVALMLSEGFVPGWLLVTTHVLNFFIASMVCHGELARDRPPPAALTDFYLWLSLGGVLGGVFNSVVAPLVFQGIAEYPLAAVLALFARPAPANDANDEKKASQRDVVVPVAIGLVTLALVWVAGAKHLRGAPAFLLVFALPLVANYPASATRPRRFALGIGAILLASIFHVGALGHTVKITRNFFGVLRATQDEDGLFVQITHGSTVHGRQSRDPKRRREALGYYHRTGPLGDVFAELRDRPGHPRVGVIGLGAGTMAAYALPGDAWTYFEINPAVVEFARDPALFTYLSDSFPNGQGLSMIVGDARLRLRESPPAAFDLLVLDAFSSDSIPVHLLTREALALYMEKLAPGGFLALHVSNRYLDLAPAIGRLADDGGVVAIGRDDLELSDSEDRAGKMASQWIAIARRTADIPRLAADPKWTARPASVKSPRVWTDDFSNMLETLRW